jgi:hypothetical protein
MTDDIKTTNVIKSIFVCNCDEVICPSDEEILLGIMRLHNKGEPFQLDPT